jgi:alpha-glucosidase
VMSNHDFGRLATRVGAGSARAAAMLLLTLPGTTFLYQGDEIGQGDGPPGESRFDRAGRDRFRHPMQWTGATTGGFTSGEPWLPLVDPDERNVEAQRDDPRSMLSFIRALIELRPKLGDGMRFLDAAPGVLAYERGGHAVALNTTAEQQPGPVAGAVVLETEPAALRGRALAPHGGVILQTLD